MRKTKIVCTLGPASNNLETLKKLISNGMSVARFNFSHGSHEDHKKTLDILRKAAYEEHVPVATILDTKGPELRIDKVDGIVPLKKGDHISILNHEVLGNKDEISINYTELYKYVKEDDRILIDDGLVALRVINCNDSSIYCEILNDGKVSSNKSINVPNIYIPVPNLTQKDYEDIAFGIENHFDFIAASFIRNANDVLAIRQLLNDNNAEYIKIIAKIESNEGVKNFDEIIKVVDAVMVARGDLGIELPMEQVPIIQKQLILKCYQAGKPVITATQMLESMVNNPRPTRAEVSDVANAIFDSTSAIMLSAESAVGQYPAECVSTMDRIATEVENNIDYWERFKKREQEIQLNDKSVINYSSCLTAMHMNVKAILAFTLSGETARVLSKFRPNIPIYAITPNEYVYNQLALSWGVIPIHIPNVFTIEEAMEVGINKCVSANLLTKDDLVIISGGYNDTSSNGSYRLNKMLGGILKI